MPRCKTIALPTVARLQGALDYIYDEARESHRAFAIEADRPKPVDWVPSVAATHEIYCRTVESREQPNNLAQWVVVAFEDQAHLSKDERSQVSGTLHAGLGQGVGVWHRNRYTGACDYNLLLPLLTEGPVPLLRRFTVQSLWGTVKAIVDGVVRAINDTREKLGQALLRDLRSEPKAESAGALLAKGVARAAIETKQLVTAATLPRLVRCASSDDWTFEDEWLLLLRMKKSIRIPLPEFLANATKEHKALLTQGLDLDALTLLQSAPKAAGKIDLTSFKDSTLAAGVDAPLSTWSEPTPSPGEEPANPSL